MPLSDEQISAIQSAMGDEGQETFTAIAEVLSADRTALDTLKGESTTLKRKLTIAERLAESVKSDFEAAKTGESEAVSKLTSERDATRAEFEQLQAEYRNHRVRTQLADKLGIADATKRTAALKVFELPEGAGLDESGQLVGVDEEIASFKEAHSYFFAAASDDAGGTGGGRNGSRKPAKAPAKQKEGRDQKVSRWAANLFGVRA